TWNWNLVDLKSHNVEVLANRRFHADLSRHVYRVVAQLRDYQEFFSDPRHQHLLERKFGGVRPVPRLTAIIGRIPRKEKELYARLKGRVADVNIRTYDEVLVVRKAKVEQMWAFGTS